MKKLVYRADDIGYTLAFDLGAFRAFDEGIATSADVMFDSPHTVEALKWLKERPWISVGWHRHFWESPVLPAEKVPHMIDEEGRFRWRHRHAEYMAEVPYEEAYSEFEAEMARCYEILGRYPDTGMSSFLDIPFERAYMDICKKYNIALDIAGRGDGVINPEYAHLNYKSWIIVARDNKKGDFKVDPSMDNAKRVMRDYDLAYFHEYRPAQNIMNITWENEDQTIMTGGHPGYLDDHILSESTCSIHRVAELQGAISAEVKQWIIDNRIELVNQRDVLHGTSEYQDHLKEINSPLWVGNFK